MSQQLHGKRKRTSIRFEKGEVLLALRAFQVHPGNTDEVLLTMLENKSLLSKEVRSLYENESKKKLISRIREKIHRLTSEKLDNIDDDEIRQEVKKVKEMELHHVEKTNRPTQMEPRASTSTSTTKPSTSAVAKPVRIAVGRQTAESDTSEEDMEEKEKDNSRPYKRK